MAAETGLMELPEGIFVDGPTALDLASAMRLVTRYARENGIVLSPRLVAATRAFEQVGERWATAARAAEYRDRNVGIPTCGRSVTVGAMGTVGTKEASELLGVSPRAVIALAHRGTLRGHRVGWSWAFHLTDVTDLVNIRNARKEHHAA